MGIPFEAGGRCPGQKLSGERNREREVEKMKRYTTWTVAFAALASMTFASDAFAQKARMETYRKELQKKMGSKIKEAQQREAAESLAKETEVQRQRGARVRQGRIEAPRDVPGERQLKKEPESKPSEPWKCEVKLAASNDGDGQDVEIRLTMPTDDFMEFAPVAALEAASIPHKFPVVYIYLREETTDRVGRVAFRDAEPIAGRYLAGDKKAVDHMRDAIIWH